MGNFLIFFLTTILTILIRVLQIHRRYNCIENIIVLSGIFIQFFAVKSLSVGITDIKAETFFEEHKNSEELKTTITNMYYAGI